MTSWFSHVLASLSRCPVCKEQPSSPQGCCQQCYKEMFKPQVDDFQISLGLYEKRLEQAVRALKYHHATKLATIFGEQLALLIKQQGWHVQGVCDVPLHPKRKRERGFNQAELIARAVAQHLKRPYHPVLLRTRETQQQAKLSQHERVNNVQQAFAVKGSVRSQTFVLIDDVITSGATTTECALALLEAGAHQVYIAAVAKAT